MSADNIVPEKTLFAPARQSQDERHRDRGMALIVVLLAMVFLSAVAVVLVLISSAETRIAANFRAAQQGLYAADAAAELAANDLRSVGNWNALLAGTVLSPFIDGPPNGTRRLDDGSVVDLGQVVNVADCQKTTACSDAEMNATSVDRPWGPNNPRWKLFAYGRLGDIAPGRVDSPWYVVVMAGDDPGETDNDPAQDGAAPSPGAGIVALRAEAFAPRDGHKVVEVTVARGGAGSIRMLSWRERR